MEAERLLEGNYNGYTLSEMIAWSRDVEKKMKNSRLGCMI